MEKQNKVINHGTLEENGWKQINRNYFWKNGFNMWLWDEWTLQKAPKSANEKTDIIKKGVKTIEELNDLLKQYQKNI